MTAIIIIVEFIWCCWSSWMSDDARIYTAPGPVFCLLLGVSSDYAQPITGRVTKVTCPVIGQAQPELTPIKRHKTGPELCALCVSRCPCTEHCLAFNRHILPSKYRWLRFNFMNRETSVTIADEVAWDLSAFRVPTWHYGRWHLISNLLYSEIKKFLIYQRHKLIRYSVSKYVCSV